MNSYWGGAPAAIGGALVLGAWPRIRRHPRSRHAIVMGIGLAILANSRPFEGLLFSLPIAFVMVRSLLSKNTAERQIAIRTIVLPLTIVLIATAALMGIYFHAVTGSPTRMPFSVNRATYAVAKIFIWQKGECHSSIST